MGSPPQGYDILTPTVNTVSILLSTNRSTASASFVSLGEGLTIKNQRTGRFLCFVTGTLFTTIANDGGAFALYRTTGSIPALNQPPGGGDTQLAIPQCVTPTTGGNGAITLSAQVLDTPVTIGQSYNYYLVLQALIGGTVTIAQNAVIAIMEV